MSTFKELFNSRLVGITKDGITTKEVYHITDESDPYSVTGLPVIGSAHPTLLLSFLKTTNIKPVEADSTLLLTLTYGPSDSNNPNQNENGEVWEWDMQAQTTHINAVREASLQKTWDNKGNVNAEVTTVIGADGSTSRGVDVFRPTGALRVTKEYDKATVCDLAFRQTRYDMQNTVNDGVWFDWVEREVLFLGSRIRISEVDESASVAYNFLFGRKKTAPNNYTIFKQDPDAQALPGSAYQTVDIGDVYPFQEIWTEFGEIKVPISVDPLGERVKLKGMLSVNKATVYEQSDFTALGLGGPCPATS